MKNKFTIDLTRLEKLIFDEKKKTIFLDPEAEDVLVEILKAEKRLEELKKQVKEKLANEVEKMAVPFEKMRAEKVVISWAYSGKKFFIDEAFLDKLPKEFYKTKISYLPVSSAIEKWAETHDGKLPLGIGVNPKRQKGIRFYPKKGVEL